MRKLISCFIVLVLAVVIGSLMFLDPGYVLISYSTWSIETTLWAFLFAIIILYLLLYFIMTFWRGTRSLTKRVQHWSKQKNLQKSKKLINSGFILWQEGKLSLAERQLVKAAKHSETAFVDYLMAAHIAQQQAQYHKRDTYLHKAHMVIKDSELAISLAKVRFQLASNQLEQALATLMRIRKLAPNNHYALVLLTQAYTKLYEWDKLRQLVPSLRKSRIFPAPELTRIEQQAYAELLVLAATDVDKSHKLWEQIPRQLQHSPQLLLIYTGTLLQHSQQHPVAEKLLRAKLNRSWDNDLVNNYGRLIDTSACLSNHLKNIETWRKQHSNNPALFLCLGRVCKTLQLWGKAQSYLETCLTLDKNNSVAYFELGQLMELMNNQSAALENYRKGCRL